VVSGVKPGQSRRIRFVADGTGATITIYNSLATESTNQWKSTPISTGISIGSQFTRLFLDVADPGPAKRRRWDVRAWDFGTGSGRAGNNDRYSPYIQVDYTLPEPPSTGDTGDTKIAISYATITMTKGWVGAATSLYSKGWLNYDLEIIEVQPPDTGDTGVTAVTQASTGGITRHRKRQQLRKKKVTVRVLFRGKTYEKTVYVDPDISITAKNVKVSRAKGGGLDIKIFVDDVEIE